MPASPPPRAAAASAPALGVDRDGWLQGVRRIRSPHFDARPDGVRIELLVLHCISLPPGRFGGDGIESLFAGRPPAQRHRDDERLRGLRVSAHFVVGREGVLTQFVACGDRAWHAGASNFEGRGACNDFSIGVELEGSEFEPFTPAQYAAAALLARSLFQAYPLRALAAHSDIAPGRKTDPGPLFDWPRFMRAAGIDAGAVRAPHPYHV